MQGHRRDDPGLPNVDPVYGPELDESDPVQLLRTHGEKARLLQPAAIDKVRICKRLASITVTLLRSRSGSPKPPTRRPRLLVGRFAFKPRQRAVVITMRTSLRLRSSRSRWHGEASEAAG